MVGGTGVDDSLILSGLVMGALGRWAGLPTRNKNLPCVFRSRAAIGRLDGVYSSVRRGTPVPSADLDSDKLRLLVHAIGELG